MDFTDEVVEHHLHRVEVDDGRLGDDDPLATDVDKRVSGPEVDAEVAAEKTEQGREWPKHEIPHPDEHRGARCKSQYALEHTRAGAAMRTAGWARRLTMWTRERRLREGANQPADRSTTTI